MGYLSGWKPGSAAAYQEELDDTELKWKADEDEPTQRCAINKELDEKTTCNHRRVKSATSMVFDQWQRTNEW